MMTHNKGFFGLLFVASSAFWWFFEYLNRFVQNWYYVGSTNITAAEYFWFATLPFATVLPAVFGTLEWLRTFPVIQNGFDRFCATSCGVAPWFSDGFAAPFLCWFGRDWHLP